MRAVMEDRKKANILRPLVLTALLGGVWHTTSSDRSQGILRCGAILPEPEIEDRERWGTSQGPSYYPYVRTLGGVSLFDFKDFDPERYSKDCPMSDWREFVPYPTAWKQAVWIEIDPSKLGSGFISGLDLLARWKSEEVGNKLMPKIEAAHLGPLPQVAFKRAFLVREGVSELSPVPIPAAG